MRTLWMLLTLLVAVGCAEDDPNTQPNTPSDDYTHITGEITADTTWTADTTYSLDDLIFVSSGTLTIEAGTTVLGQPGSALIVTQGGSIDVQGTASAPVVFTSAQEEGSRRRGDWGGVVLLGSAPINVPVGRVEGIDASDDRGLYGGSEADSSCGKLRYTRIEFAGFSIGADNELNGLTLGGCGSGTDIDYVQVHMGDDDGVELFGGTAGIKHLLVTRAADDSIDWDEGWQGKLQFVIVQQEGAEGDNAIEADNLEDNNDAEPRSNPTIYNMTLLGSNDPGAEQRAMTLRRGTAGKLGNVVLQGFPREAIDIRDTSTVSLLEAGDLDCQSMMFFQIGADGQSWFADESENDDDGGFDELAFFSSVGDHVFGTDPMVAQPYDVNAPDFSVAAESPAASGVAPPSDGWFDDTAAYVGAIEPGGMDWTVGWTAYPRN